MIRAGELDRRIVIERMTTTQQDYGEAVKAFVPLAEVWAKVVPGAAQEVFEADQIVAIASAEFLIRYRDDVDATCRVVYGARYYDIRAVIEVGRRQGLTLVAVTTNP